jgi:hypothetical protein
MKRTILLFLISIKAFSMPFFHPYINNKSNPLNLLSPYTVIIEQDIPYRQYSQDVIESFKNKIIQYSFDYKYYASHFNIIRPLPFQKFVFKIGFIGINTQTELKGYCNLELNIIHLDPFFDERTFYHELGHCDLGYSHKEDSLVVQNGYSKYLMNWHFSPEFYNLEIKTVLSNFFNPTIHNPILSKEGQESHNAMIFHRNKFKQNYSH